MYFLTAVCETPKSEAAIQQRRVLKDKAVVRGKFLDMRTTLNNFIMRQRFKFLVNYHVPSFKTKHSGHGAMLFRYYLDPAVVKP